jgi:hypothetical protein
MLLGCKPARIPPKRFVWVCRTSMADSTGGGGLELWPVLPSFQRVKTTTLRNFFINLQIVKHSNFYGLKSADATVTSRRGES